MRKIIFLFLFLLLITGCGNNVADSVDNQEINIYDIDGEIDDIDNLFDEDGLNDIEDELNLI